MPFRDVIGHRRLIGLLQRSIARESLPPSLIFAGPPGVGKRRTALTIAQALNCANPARGVQSNGADACGECPTCARIARGVHPDVLVLEPGDTGSIKIEPVRDAIARASFRPFEGRRRVTIVDEADALVAAAQNSLLKTLEEPAPSSVFILITARPDVLLPTVRSRCPQLRFRSLSPDEIAAALVAHGHSETEARAIAATADGSLGQALKASGGELVEARAIAQQLLEAAASGTASSRVAEAGALTGKSGAGDTDRDRVAERLRPLPSLLRDAELLAAGADPALLANADLGPVLDRLRATYGGGRGIQAFAAVERALAALGPSSNANAKIVADWVALGL